MLPTFPEGNSVDYASPVTEENVRVGDIVSFVMVKPSGQPTFACKRIGALAGDVVEEIHGKRMKVPSRYFWALGDNAAQSCDSRHCGAVPLSNLRGRYCVNISFPLNYSLAYPRIQFFSNGKAINLTQITIYPPQPKISLQYIAFKTTPSTTT